MENVQEQHEERKQILKIAVKIENNLKTTGRIPNILYCKDNKIYHIELEDCNRITFNNVRKMQRIVKKILNVAQKIAKIYITNRSEQNLKYWAK